MKTHETVEERRYRCEQYCDMLRDLIRIHWEIDAPTRLVEADEPDWILRLRKVCLHTMATIGWEVDVDSLHVMATELRAAYEQMDAVWKCLPGEYRFDEHGGRWTKEARDGLAAYNHPTPASLHLPLASGGFADIEAPENYLRLAAWLNLLVCGYGLALAFLAQTLGADSEVDRRLEVVLSNVPD